MKKKDWCTLWFEGWWGHCCKRHDRAYDQGIPFFQANFRLFKCVLSSGRTKAKKLASKPISAIMFVGTTVLGIGPYIKSAYERQRKIP